MQLYVIIRVIGEFLVTMAYQFENVKLLIVEDNKPMLELTRSLLDVFGVGEIYTSQDGEDGFKLFCKHNPDIVIADWMMKPMDGISLARRIRNDPQSPNQFAPVVLMTGFSERRRVIQARDCGVTEFLVKPFNARDLYRRISQIIERPRQFVRSEDFFGPDRRRKALEGYDGPMRRELDRPKSSRPQKVDFIDMVPKADSDYVVRNNGDD